jgi:heptosyltransferase-1
VFPVHITAAEEAAASSAAEKAGLDIAQPYVILSPGANWPNKRWPTASFAALADKLAGTDLSL